MWHRMEKGNISSPLSDLYRMAFFILACLRTQAFSGMRIQAFPGMGTQAFPGMRTQAFPGSYCKTVAFVVRYKDGFREVRKEEG